MVYHFQFNHVLTAWTWIRSYDIFLNTKNIQEIPMTFENISCVSSLQQVILSQHIQTAQKFFRPKPLVSGSRNKCVSGLLQQYPRVDTSPKTEFYRHCDWWGSGVSTELIFWALLLLLIVGIRAAWDQKPCMNSSDGAVPSNPTDPTAEVSVQL